MTCPACASPGAWPKVTCRDCARGGHGNCQTHCDCRCNEDSDEPVLVLDHHWLHELSGLVGHLANSTEWELPDDLDTLLAALASAQELKRWAGTVHSRVQELVEAAWPREDGKPAKLIEWARGIAERRNGSKRTEWDHDRLAALVARRAVVDEATGELRAATVAEAAELAAKALRATAGISYWKVGALRQAGLDPEDYCASEWGRPSISVRVGEGDTGRAA